MKTKIIFLLAISTLLFGCTKLSFDELTEQTSGSQNKASSTVGTPPSTFALMELARKVNGTVVCTIDEDILKNAVSNYYGAIALKSLHIKEFNKNKPDNYFLLKGKLSDGFITVQYAFQLISVPLTNGEKVLYLPVAGTEQGVISSNGTSGKLKTTSSSAGYMNPANAGSTYKTTTSSSSLETGGTNGLILEIQAL
ncbi:MAG: hypothetical protein JKY42_02150 [Flavobacteriales bacterium]|nr:hypothetical protein [Flavobacteriales bacterium]